MGLNISEKLFLAHDVTIQKDNQNGTYGLFISFSEEWATLTGKNVGNFSKSEISRLKDLLEKPTH
ncbi:MAG: hypothetical protein KAR19_09490 [Bacteroidales bacterium]|nr:hypothetical protein [Bacteroidales bacterium]